MIAVLIVDDCHDLREILVTLFEAAGFQVCSACDGVEALMRIEDRRPDVVVADWEMPKMDGVALGRLIRSWPLEQRIPVILMSAAYHQCHAPVDAYDVFIEKPASMQSLVAIVKTLAEAGAR